MLAWLKAVAIGVDIEVNSLFGGRPYQTISSRIGESIMAGGFWSKVPWDKIPLGTRAKLHCLNAVYSTLV